MERGKDTEGQCHAATCDPADDDQDSEIGVRDKFGAEKSDVAFCFVVVELGSKEVDKRMEASKSSDDAAK